MPTVVHSEGIKGMGNMSGDFRPRKVVDGKAEGERRLSKRADFTPTEVRPAKKSAPRPVTDAPSEAAHPASETGATVDKVETPPSTPSGKTTPPADRKSSSDKKSPQTSSSPASPKIPPAQ